MIEICCFSTAGLLRKRFSEISHLNRMKESSLIKMKELELKWYPFNYVIRHFSTVPKQQFQTAEFWKLSK